MIVVSGDNGLKKWVSCHIASSTSPIGPLYINLNTRVLSRFGPTTGDPAPACNSTHWPLLCCCRPACCGCSRGAHTGGSSQSGASNSAPSRSSSASGTPRPPSDLRSSCLNLFCPACRSFPLLLECLLASLCRLLFPDRLIFDISYILCSTLPIRVQDQALIMLSLGEDTGPCVKQSRG